MKRNPLAQSPISLSLHFRELIFDWEIAVQEAVCAIH